MGVAAIAASSIVTAVIVSVVSVFVIAAGRTLVKAAHAALPILKAIRDLAQIWHDSMSMRDTTLDIRDGVDQIKTQLGTFDRPRGAVPLEHYLRQWRHEQSQTETKILLAANATAAAANRLIKTLEEQ